MDIPADQPWIRVGSVDDFPEGMKIECLLADKPILILRQGDRWFAFEALCPHMSRPLEGGEVDGTHLQCRWHNMIFSLETGEVLDDSGFFDILGLEVYDVRIVDGEVHIMPRPRNQGIGTRSY